VSYSKVTRHSFKSINERTFKINNTTNVESFTGTQSYFGTKSGSTGGRWRQKITDQRQAGTVFDCDQYSLGRTFPCTGTYTGYDASPPTALPNSYSGSWAYASLPATINHLSTDAATAENKALVKIHARITAVREAYNSAPFIAELKETLQMILRPASALRDSVTSHLRHVQNKKAHWLRNVPRVKQREIFRRAVAGSYLEASFGWAPTISDVESGAEALARFMQEVREGRKASYQRLQGSGMHTNVIDLGRTTHWQNQWQELTLLNRWTTKRTVKYLVGHLDTWTVDSVGDLDHFLSTFGLKNWRNVALGVHEVIPYSWLVDYFSNVGDIVQVWATPTKGIQWIVRTERQFTTMYTNSVHTGNRNTPKGTYIKFKTSPGVTNASRSTVSRTLPASLGLPTLQIDSPWASPLRVANMAAVWWGMQDDTLKSVGRRGPR